MMNFKDDTELLIEQYLSKELSAAQCLLFEEELLINPKLKSDLDAELALRETLFLAKMDGLSAIMNADFEKAYKGKSGLKYLFLGLSLLGLVIGSILLGFWLKTPSHQQTKPEIKQETKAAPAMDSIPTKVEEPDEKVEALSTTENHLIAHTPKEQTVVPAPKNENVIVNKLADSSATPPIQQKTEPRKTPTPTDTNPPIAPSCPEAVQAISYKLDKVPLGEDYGGVSVEYLDYGFEGTYEIRLQNTEDEMLIDNLTALPLGEYSILLSDEHCEVRSKDTFKMTSSGCAKAASIFAPNQGEDWLLLLDENRAAQLEITSMNGIQYTYNSDQGEEEIRWDGTNQNGDFVNIGLHFYELKYSDGEVCTGSISIAK